jgi:hypothetical protein
MEIWKSIWNMESRIQSNSIISPQHPGTFFLNLRPQLWPATRMFASFQSSLALVLSLLLILHLNSVYAIGQCVSSLSFQQENDSVVFSVDEPSPVQVTRIDSSNPPMTPSKREGIHECDCPFVQTPSRSGCARLGNASVGWTLGRNASASTVLSGRVQFRNLPGPSDIQVRLNPGTALAFVPIVGTLDVSTDLFIPRAAAGWSFGLCGEVTSSSFSLCVASKAPANQTEVQTWTEMKQVLSGSTIQIAIVVSSSRSGQTGTDEKTAQLFVWMAGLNNQWKTWNVSWLHPQQSTLNTNLRIGIQRPIRFDAVFSDFFGANDTKSTAQGLFAFTKDTAPSSVCVNNNLARAISCSRTSMSGSPTTTASDPGTTSTSTTNATTTTTTSRSSSPPSPSSSSSSSSSPLLDMTESEDLTIPVVLFCVSGVLVIIGGLFVWKLIRN